jgi:hypothetical protein
MGTPGATPIFQGAAQDADVLRAQLDRLYNLAPEGSVIQDPARRAQLTNRAEHVSRLSAELIALQNFVPGRVGRILGPLVTGGEKDPGTGKAVPVPGTVGNFAPSPFGFLDPTAVGLTRNFYLPAGATNLIPRELDRAGLGLPEQRAIDQLAHNAALTSAVNQQLTDARRIVAGLPANAVADLSQGRYPQNLRGYELAFTGANLGALEIAARELLAMTVAVNTGGTPPLQVEQVNDTGKRNGRGASGINHELVHERADP